MKMFLPVALLVAGVPSAIGQRAPLPRLQLAAGRLGRASSPGSLLVLAHVVSSARVELDRKGRLLVEQADGASTSFSLTVSSTGALLVDGPEADALAGGASGPVRTVSASRQIQLNLYSSAGAAQKSGTVYVTAIPN